MHNRSMKFFCHSVLLAVILCVSGCAKQASVAELTLRVKHISPPDARNLAWFAPELQVSHYRTLFYGYDTVDYRLAAPTAADISTNDGIRLLFDARYGGDVRHYAVAQLTDGASRALGDYQHATVRCQIFNSMISSCLYRDQFSLALSWSELDKARFSGLQLSLASKSKPYEQINLPAHYIQGFLNAIENNPKAITQQAQ